jgi:long-chain acyl-CoA synthetase
MNRNLALNLLRSAEQYADRPALKVGDSVTTYAELEAASARVAGLLRARGVNPGDRVGIMLPNVPEFAVVYYGILRAGGVVVPMNVLLKPREAAFHLGDAEARLLFAWHGFADAAAAGGAEAGADVIAVGAGEFEGLLAVAEPLTDVALRSGEDIAVLLYTSGTTGTPKGAELTHAGLATNVEIMLAGNILALTPQDVMLGALPLFHAFGQTCALNTAISAGACLALLPRFHASTALEILESDGVTVFEGVPTMFSALLNHPGPERPELAALRLCVSGGAALPVEVLHEFEAAFACEVLEGYGLSETSPVVAFNHADRPRKAGSIGTPVAGVEVKLVDAARKPVATGEAGEIAVRGHNVMKGYWRHPEATARAIDADGWFHTGDIGRVDEDGYYFIVDRKKDMIIRGGYNVYPREIEEVLYEHPAVAEAAVLGIPHALLGEEVAAAVALKPDADAAPEELREFVKQRVAAYKYPRELWLVDELPKGSTGKILKREIAIPAGVGGGS